MVSLGQTIPAMPVRSVAAGVDFYRVDELYEELRQRKVLHPVSRDGVDGTDFGTRELATLDLDGNLVTFFQWRAR